LTRCFIVMSRETVGMSPAFTCKDGQGCALQFIAQLVKWDLSRGGTIPKLQQEHRNEHLWKGTPHEMIALST
jgi:hypothetical protein